MAFVWSRLALAAVLAAGAACAPAETCPEQASAAPCSERDCDEPRLVCSEGTTFVLFDGYRRDGFSGAILSDESRVASAPRIGIDVADQHVPAAPPVRADVLVVAPKTSPPQT